MSLRRYKNKSKNKNKIRIKAYKLHKGWHVKANSSFIHNSQNLETIQIPINKWMNKQIAAHPYYEILLSKKKERSIDTCYNTNESQKYHKPKKLDKSTHSMIFLFFFFKARSLC